MTTTVSALPNLSIALEGANKALFYRDGYTVVASNEIVDLKDPVVLQLRDSNGNMRNIGITHLVNLSGSNWDDKPFSEIARTTDQVMQAIINRVKLFLKQKRTSFISLRMERFSISII